MRSVFSHIVGLLVVGASAASIACGGGTGAAPAGADGGRGGGAGPGAGAGAGAPVSVAPVEERAMPVIVRAVGTVQASSTVDIRSQITGPLLSIGFKEGEDVKAGQLLFTIDPRPFQGQVNQAESILARDTAQMKNLEAQAQRADDLYAKGLIPKADHDTLIANLASSRATVSSDTGSLESMKLQLGYTKIMAPVAGRTGALLVHIGSLIRANDTTPMVTISQTSPIQVAFAIPARLLMRLRNAQAHGDLHVTASIPGAAESSSSGRLVFIDSTADPATDTIRLKGEFTNGNHELWPGQYADVQLQLSVESHAIVIPTAAMQSGQQGSFVYVVTKDKTAEVRPVKIAWTEGSTTVLESGVTPGEQVVTDGQLRLAPGAKVTIKPAIADAAVR